MKPGYYSLERYLDNPRDDLDHRDDPADPNPAIPSPQDEADAHLLNLFITAWVVGLAEGRIEVPADWARISSVERFVYEEWRGDVLSRRWELRLTPKGLAGLFSRDPLKRMTLYHYCDALGDGSIVTADTGFQCCPLSRSAEKRICERVLSEVNKD